jgi:formamidopyrimidine-DNA glycosylase
LPELPDITVYLEALETRVRGATLANVRLKSPFLLRSVDPPLSETAGKRVVALRRLGKRICFELEGGLFLVLHLMIAGRLHWFDAGAKVKGYGKAELAAFEFSSGILVLTEAGSKRRASLHAVRGEAGLEAHHRGGVEPLLASLDAFRAALTRENHTLKRALTDPRLFSGIGNAYSDEILHAAKLSPVRLTAQLDAGEIARLHRETQRLLREWTDRLRAEAGGKFPEGVTAFRPEMAVHGRHKLPCPVCGAKVQRIAYAENETNYCPGCQTGGRLLADRSLSRLLHDDWPKTADELEKDMAEKRAQAPSRLPKA